MLKSIDLEKLEQLASAATRGPWTYCSNEDQLGEYVCELTRGDGEKSDFSVGTRNDWGQMKNPEWNAMFIAAANPHVVLTLVAELKALRAAAAPAGDLNPVLDVMRNTGLSIDGDNAYKRDLLDCAVGAMAFGSQGNNQPPAGHWGHRFWDIGRGEAEAREELIAALKLNRENLRACQATIHLCGGFDPAYVNDAQAAMKVADEVLAKFSI
nr:hypothetical protein [uncultured Pseudomonas sp.]